MQGAWVWSLGGEDPLGEEMATHLLMFYLIFKNFPSILVWEIPWTEEPGVGYSPWGHKKLHTTEQLDNKNNNKGDMCTACLCRAEYGWLAPLLALPAPLGRGIRGLPPLCGTGGSCRMKDQLVLDSSGTVGKGYSFSIVSFILGWNRVAIAKKVSVVKVPIFWVSN